MLEGGFSITEGKKSKKYLRKKEEEQLLRLKDDNSLDKYQNNNGKEMKKMI